jgi:hypothetical protein
MTLVVIEFGASWPRWLDPRHTGDVAVVAQHYQGEPCSLVTQVASRLTRLEAQHWRLRSLLIVSNGACDDASVAARAILARGLLAHLRDNGGGKMVLSVDERLGRRAEVNVTNLSDSLHVDACAAGIALSVHVTGYGERVQAERGVTAQRIAS